MNNKQQTTDKGTVFWQQQGNLDYKGHGQPIDYGSACAHACRGNSDHPQLHHWVEKEVKQCNL